MNAIATSTVKSHCVTWATNGGVYFGRELFDKLPEHIQGRFFECKTAREFEEVCRILGP